MISCKKEFSVQFQKTKTKKHVSHPLPFECLRVARGARLSILRSRATAEDGRPAGYAVAGAFVLNPSLMAAPPFLPASAIITASAVIASPSLGDMLCIGETAALDAGAPAPVVSRFVGYEGIAHNKHQNTEYRSKTSKK